MTRTHYPIISEVLCPTHANMTSREHLVTHFHNHSVPITWHFSNDPLFTQPPVPGIDFLSTLRRVALSKKSNREILERLSNPRHPTNLLLILDEGWQHFAHQITSGMSDLSAHLYSIPNVESLTALADLHLKQYIAHCSIHAEARLELFKTISALYRTISLVYHPIHKPTFFSMVNIQV